MRRPPIAAAACFSPWQRPTSGMNVRQECNRTDARAKPRPKQKTRYIDAVIKVILGMRVNTKGEEEYQIWWVPSR